MAYCFSRPDFSEGIVFARTSVERAWAWSFHDLTLSGLPSLSAVRNMYATAGTLEKKPLRCLLKRHHEFDVVSI